MWFALVPPGYVYLLTQPFSLKAQRWLEDPWVRLQVRGDRSQQEGLVTEVGWEEASRHAELLVERFAMAGAATSEALQWMLQDGSRRLVKVGLPASPDSQAVTSALPRRDEDHPDWAESGQVGGVVAGRRGHLH
jgi:hypothetical protein